MGNGAETRKAKQKVLSRLEALWDARRGEIGINCQRAVEVVAWGKEGRQRERKERERGKEEAGQAPQQKRGKKGQGKMRQRGCAEAKKERKKEERKAKRGID